MNYTENLSLGLPEYGESADVAALNRNSGILDAYVYNTRQIECEPYDSTKTYMSGDLAIHNEVIYECNTDNTTGAWDDSKWDSTTLAEQIAKAKQMGGESALADLEDVEITNPSTGQALLFDDDDDVWKNQNLPDVSVTKEASGNPVEFSDGADAPIVKCVSEIQGSQDLHGYDKPWVGGAGKNKWPSFSAFSENGITCVVNDDGSITLNGTATANVTKLSSLSLPAGAYSLSLNNDKVIGTSAATSVYAYIVDNDNTWVCNPIATTINTRASGTSANGIKSVVITVSNGAVLDNVTFKLQLESGSIPTDFEPYSNICPITAYTEGEIVERGKNLFDKNANDVAVGYYLAASTGVLTPSQSGYNTSGYIPIEPNTDYTKSGASVAADEYCFYDSAKTFISGLSRTDTTVLSPNNAAYMRFDYKASETDNIQIEKGSTPTAYEPYVGTTHTTTYPSAIYRGSEDVVKGEVRADWGVFSISDYVWSGSNGAFYTVQVANLIKHGDGRYDHCICECYATENVPSTDQLSNGAMSVDNNGYIQIKDTRYALSSDFMAAMGSYKIAYELATPTTSSVTPTNLPIKSLYGYNHIESSTGDMEIEYITENYQPLVDLIQSGNGHTYSTQEQVVGTWVDGSDVYEKSFKIDNISDDSNHVLDATLTQSAITLLPGTEIIVSCTGTYNTDFINTMSDNTFGRVIANVNGLNASIVGYSYLSSQLGACTLYVTARYLKKSVTRSLSAPLTSQKAQIEPLTEKEEEVPTEEEKAVNEEENNDER